MRHMGNAIVTNVEKRETMISESTLNRTSLDGVFDARGYVSAHSDIAALMVFQHQGHMTNLITRVGWDARLAAYDHRVDLEGGPLRDAVNELVDYLLFVDEEPLTAAIKGTAGFAEKFAAQGPADSRGRSLRQLDLEHRLLRYPCSYMVYSTAFGALPIDVTEYRAAGNGHPRPHLRGEPTTFWGKLRRPTDDTSLLEWHPLADHCADVAAVVEALLRLPVWRERLSRLAGKRLTDVGLAR